MWIRLQFLIGCCAVTHACSLVAGLQVGPRSNHENSATDPLAALGLTVTRGAAPGYVEDRACATCHAEIARAYQEVGMGRSFFAPATARWVEDFESNRFYHPASQRTYEMQRRGERLWMRRYQLDESGQPIQVLEQEVDWILGSGNHARTYLYRTPNGELYQLPIAWYTQSQSWGMAPGYDRSDHLGVTRRVRRECMFCHNAYPDVAAGSDRADAPQTFPARLPQGIGCQRCHGPGAEHVRRAFSGAAPESAIVNPARLSPERRDAICLGCHLQPSVALPGLRRFGRGDYSFQPGELLSDYLVPVDAVEQGRSSEERFEINHHPYRLRQSRCFRASDGALSCLTCHDPHRRVEPEKRAAHFRSACLSCHAAADCQGHPGGEEAGAGAAAEGSDCASCHLPKRRTQDVIHVVMTDHRIQRRPGGPELLAPLAEKDPVLLDVRLLPTEGAPDGALGEVYRAAAVVRTSGGAAAGAVGRLEQALAAAHPAELEPYLELARGQLKQHRFDGAAQTLGRILVDRPQHALALMWLAIARAGQGQMQAAIALLRRVSGDDAERAEVEFNLGRLLAGIERWDEAIEHYRRAIELRPNLVAAWVQLGAAHTALGRLEQAAQSYRRALELEPADSSAYLGLGQAWERLGRRAEALRYLRHGRRVVAQPGAIEAALQDLDGG
ncbi:MAG TPA: tetratricopeptide repeat protein [Acidobacteriota bacterium]